MSKHCVWINVILLILFLLFSSSVNAQSINTLQGDANGDGKVDGVDYVIWLNNYGRINPTGPSQGDFNSDSKVDGVDYVIWLNNYGKIATPSPTPTISPTPVPTSSPTAAPATPTPTSVPGSVSVNFSVNEGPVTYRATGFIGSISNTQPPDPVFLPLKPKLLSWNRSYSGITRALQNGIQYQIKLHNKGTIPSSVDGDWSSWETLVRNRATEAKNNNYTNVEFDIWNEPEFGDYWDGPIDGRYFEMWKRAYNIIKSVSSNFEVAGPSSTSYPWTRDTFLPWAKTNNVLPDILTWHELWSGGSGIANRVSGMRTYLAANGMNISKISINEYDSSSDARKPGVIVRFMSEFEKAKVHSAAKACWQEGGNWNCEVHLDNTLTYPDQQPRSVWWTYRQYAEMTGNLVAFTGSSTFVGLASADVTTRKGYVLIGNVAPTTTINVVLTALNQAPFYVAGKPVTVLLQKIPNTESSPLASPITVSQTTINPSSTNTSYTVNIAGVGDYDAYFIILTTQN